MIAASFQINSNRKIKPDNVHPEWSTSGGDRYVAIAIASYVSRFFDL